jgi:hypothetical protein
LAAGDAVVANGITDLRMKLDKRNQPEPQWSMPIAIVLLLLCLEALIGSGRAAKKESSALDSISLIKGRASATH